MTELEKKVRMTRLQDEALQTLRDYWHINGVKTNQAKRLIHGGINSDKDKEIVSLMAMVIDLQLALNDIELKEITGTS